MRYVLVARLTDLPYIAGYYQVYIITNLSIYEFYLGFVDLLEMGRRQSRHVQQDQLFPQQTAEEFSLLFVIKTGWTGNLIQFFSSPKFPPVIHLFRISLMESSLTVFNEKADSVSFSLEPGATTWRQLAVRVVKNSVALYSACEDAPMHSFSRNLTLWKEGGVVVGDEDHEGENHLEVSKVT